MVMTDSSWERRKVLIVGTDMGIVDVVRRCAVARGIEIVEADSLAQSRSRWMSPTFVVVTDDLLVDGSLELAKIRPRVVVATLDSTSQAPWRLAVHLRADRVFDLCVDESLLVAYFTEQTRARARVVSVLGGSGGAGASVTAAALAMSAHAGGRRCVLIDADPDSPGADLLLGLDETPGLRWHHLGPSSGAPPGEQLFDALPRFGELAVVTRDRVDRSVPDDALIVSTVHALRGVVDLIVVDLPRGAVQIRTQMATVSEVVFLVLACDLRGATSARSVVASLRHDADVRLLARRGSSDSLEPSDIAEWLDLPLAGVLPHEPGLSGSIDRGEAICSARRSRLLSACSDVLRTGVS